MLSKDAWMLRLLSVLFWVFLFATILHIIFLVFVPTPSEWPGQFPYNVEWGDWWGFLAPFVRHLSLFPEHFPVVRFIDIINGAFLTMFIYKIGVDVRQVHGSNGNGEAKIATSTYVEWGMGALVSGIIFASSRVAAVDIASASIYIMSIFIFSFVSYYFLYKLRQKLRIEEGKSKVKNSSKTRSHEFDSDLD